MTNRFTKGIELTTNIAIITVAVLLCVVLVNNYLLDGTRVRLNDARPKPSVPIGSKLALPEVNWANNKRTLLIVLSQGCHFCTESAGFYRRLADETSGSHDLRLIAVLPEVEGRNYLNGIGVRIGEVKQASLSSIGVRGTPTLILVDENGVVEDSWVGKLTTAEEAKVLSRVRGISRISL